MGKKLNLMNQKFGRLTVIGEAPNIKGRTAWLCICDCENEVTVITKSLRDGNTQSCGCLHKEIVNKRLAKDLTNRRFGKLTAIEATDERKHGSVVWKCQCDCGNTHTVTAEVLLAGKSQSCGCLKSLGNMEIQRTLEQENYLFIAEYPIRQDNINYYFDFAIMNQNGGLKCIIEYDGILHFEYEPNRGWNNKENWKKTRKNDLIKNQWCKENNIPIIRIPYTEKDLINKEYIKERIDKCGQ